MAIPDSLRKELKTPLGRLIPEGRATKDIIRDAIAGKYVITVGDRTTEKLIKFGMPPALQIVDGHEKRQRRSPPEPGNLSGHLQCRNPAAEISPQSIGTIRKAMSLKPPVRITVDGEEDLLVIPACIYAPENSAVLYGQPDEGLVIVQVSDEIRNKTRDMLHLISGDDETVAV